jgi:hypothetical protein
MVTGSRPAVAGRRPVRNSASSTARNSASRTVPAVQTPSPNNAATTATAGASSAHRPNRRSSLVSIRTAAIMNIHMATIVSLPGPSPPWAET